MHYMQNTQYIKVLQLKIKCNIRTHTVCPNIIKKAIKRLNRAVVF